MSNPRLEQFAIDLHQEVLAKAGIDADSAGETNQPLREEAFTEYVVRSEEHTSELQSR